MLDGLHDNIEYAEYVVLSSCFNYREILENISYKLTVDHFSGKNKIIFYSMCLLLEKNAPINFVSICQISGLVKDDIYELDNFHVSEKFSDFYLNILIGNKAKKDLVVKLEGVKKKCFEDNADPSDLVKELNNNINSIRKEVNPRYSVLSLTNLVDTEIDSLEQRILHPGHKGIRTGFREIDRKCPLEGGDLFVIAARPSIGKTAIAINMIESVAIDQGIPVAMFSLEMPSKAITNRLIESLSECCIDEITKNPNREKIRRLMDAAALLKIKDNIYIDDTSGLDIDDFSIRLRDLVKEHKVGLAVIDYLQLMTSSSKQAKSNRQLEISEISGKLKGAAKDNNIPIIVLAQLNRLEDGKLPMLSNLRESGSIEQDADNVGLLSRNDEEAIFNLAKVRNGEPGNVYMKFHKEIKKFTEVERS